MRGSIGTNPGGSEQLLPSGNPLVKSVTLKAEDVETMLENLLADNFIGFVQVKLGQTTGFFILRHGKILRTLEGTSRGALVARLPARIHALLRQRTEVEVSSYVLSEAMVSILSTSFAFTAFLPDKRIEPKELKSVLLNLENNKLTGFMRVVGPSGFVYLLVEDGVILTERFAESYGDIACGPAQVSAVLDYVHEKGSRVFIKAEKTVTIDRKAEDVELDLSRIRQLTLKRISTLFRSVDEVKISEEIFREWGLDPKSSFEVELETADGRMFTYKCKIGGSKLGLRVEVHTNMLKDMNVSEGDLVNVRPILS